MTSVRVPRCAHGSRFATPRTRTRRPHIFDLRSRLRGEVRVWAASPKDDDEPTSVQALQEDEELQAEVEKFLKKQAAIESGLEEDIEQANVAQQVLGADEVDEEAAKKMCRDITDIITTLKSNRDMQFNELKLIVQIEDPRMRENRRMGMENETGVSRDELAGALVDVAEGRIPKDRIALKVLHKEMMEWPFLRSAEPPAPAKTASERADDTTSAGWRPGQARPPVGRDPEEAPQSIFDMLPDWVGYGTLYGVSLIPVLIAGSVVAILFFNSLR